jgi:hypothetical protein
MTKSATDVMHDIVYSAVIDAFVAIKAASKGLPNTLLRDLNAIHANTTFADFPKELQDSINGSVRAAFNRLLKEGYSVSTGQPQRPDRPNPRRQGESGPRQGPPPTRHDPSGKRPPRRDQPDKPRPRPRTR